MKEEDKTKTAFVCHHGLYYYRCTSFRLTSAPTTFQHLIDTPQGVALRVHLVRWYLDSLSSNIRYTYQECSGNWHLHVHLQRLRYRVFGILYIEKSNLKLQRLQLWVWKHIKNFASVAMPLTALPWKDKTTATTVRFWWSAHYENDFSILKQNLSTAPLL